MFSINEKIYILVWFWFVFLSTVSAIQLIWRMLSIVSVRMREFILSQISNRMARVREEMGMLVTVLPPPGR